MQPFVDRVDEQVLDGKGGQVAFAEGLVVFPQRVAQLTHRISRKQRLAGRVVLSTLSGW